MARLVEDADVLSQLPPALGVHPDQAARLPVAEQFPITS